MRMIKLAGRYINADRLYSIEPLPGTRTVRITYEEAPNTVTNFNCTFPGTMGEDAALLKWAQDLAKALDPACISIGDTP